MANSYYQQFLYSKTKMLTAIQGIVSIAANAAVSSESIIGATVARTGTGEYTITLSDKYNAMVACHLTMEAATAVDLVPQVKSTDVSGAKTIVVNLNAGATPTDPSAVCKLHVSIFMRNSSVAV